MHTKAQIRHTLGLWNPFQILRKTLLKKSFLILFIHLIREHLVPKVSLSIIYLDMLGLPLLPCYYLMVRTWSDHLLHVAQVPAHSIKWPKTLALILCPSTISMSLGEEDRSVPLVVDLGNLCIQMILCKVCGVVWLIFHDLQLLPIRFTQPFNSCYISESTIIPDLL
jgi:hypothetical protein